MLYPLRARTPHRPSCRAYFHSHPGVAEHHRRRAEADARRATYAQQSAVRHIAAQEARHAGVLQRPAVIGRLRHRRDLADPEPRWSRLLPSRLVRQRCHRRSTGGGCGLVPADLQGLSQWRRRVHRGECKSRPIRWAGGGQRTTRGLCAHGRGLRRRGRCGDHVGIPGLQPARRRLVRRFRGVTDIGQPARRARSRARRSQPRRTAS